MNLRIIPIVLFSALLLGADEKRLSIDRSDASLTIKAQGDAPAVTYQLKKPENIKLPVDSACFFHPLRSPSGRVLTVAGDADHPHHRGVFLAWVEMHGKKDGDFWGWGQHAPITNRRIVNKDISAISTTPQRASFTAKNEWLAENEPLLSENLLVSFQTTGDSNILDLTYTLTPDADLVLSRWAFSGFCVRLPKQGRLTIDGPQGAAKLPTPVHTKPESGWPAAKWYGYTIQFEDGKSAGVAVIDHPRNPPSLWHNHKDIRMLNPCITAPAAVTIKANTPLVLRYRVVAHDGPADAASLDKLAVEWGKEQ